MPSEWCDGFLKLMKDGSPIDGESTDAEFPDLIEIVSFQFGSSEGFSDKEGLYAPQDSALRHKVSTARHNENGYMGIASLFGDEEAESPQDLSDEDVKAFAGTDLAGVAACKLTLGKELDLASPDLFRAYCSTQDLECRDVFESATIYLRKAAGGRRRQVFLTLVLSDVVVSGYTLDVSGEAVAKETINLTFAKCRLEYKAQSEGGGMRPAIKGGWDMIERSAWTGEA
jgi:type VI protein secretion system component Hcp